jgi:hypothetical protein
VVHTVRAPAMHDSAQSARESAAFGRIAVQRLTAPTMRLNQRSFGHAVCRTVTRHIGLPAMCGLVALLAQSATGIAKAQPAARWQKTDKSQLRAPKDLPPATLLATAGESGTALDSVIHAALEDLKVVKIVAAPGMDLGAIQLAIDCVSETTHCLKAVAAKSRAKILIAPTLQRTPSELVLSVLRFDVSDGGDMRRVLRRQAGRTVGPELLDAIPDMLRELFNLPKAEPEVAETAPSAAEAPAPDLATMPDYPTESRAPSLVGPLILGGAGVAALGVGLAMGIAMKDQQSEFDRLSARVETEAQARAAVDARETGETQALAANLLFVVGGAAIAAAGIWLAVELNAASERTTAFSPMVGPNQVALVVTHHGASL